jgi:O-acetylhomoserine (thiol)-lyase
VLNFKFETIHVHTGQENLDPAANRFALTEVGNICTRIMNPTWDVFEKRIAALALSSGAVATTYVIQNIAKTGDHIVTDNQIYRGEGLKL